MNLVGQSVQDCRNVAGLRIFFFTPLGSGSLAGIRFFGNPRAQNPLYPKKIKIP
jgi:hypothetical protein